MGYTQYWSFDKSAGRAKELETKYQKAILECQKVVHRLVNENRRQFGTSFMSGYTAHCKPGEYGGIRLNGIVGKFGEDFVMREHFNQNESTGFCKTNRAAYDDAVMCCLLILKYRLGDAFDIYSDGYIGYWQPWADYVSKILRRKINVPSTIFVSKSRTV